MRYIKLYEIYKDNLDSTILYRDSKLVIIVPKTHESTIKYSKYTDWCTINKNSFEEHNITADLIRFHFKDGYKLRLTWDYLSHEAHDNDYTGGTHWGCGGVVDGINKIYYNIRPDDENNPFNFSYNRNDYRQEMVDYIQKIPKEAIDEVTKYHNKQVESNKSDALYNKLYNDINKIKVNDIKLIDEGYAYYMDITLIYDNMDYSIYGYYYKEDKSIILICENIKNVIPYSSTKFSPLKKYLIDKCMEYFKKNNIDLINRKK